jgi:predicted nucleotidyltransferase
LLDLAELKVELEEVLGRRVDVITYDSLHPLLRDRVLREQRRIL